MPAGRLRHRIRIEHETRVPDGGGGWDETWAPFLSAWADVQPLSGRERVQAEQVQSQVLYRVRMRMRDGIRPDMRVVWSEITMNIRAVVSDSKLEVLTLDCEAGVAT